MGVVLITGGFKSINNTSDLTARAQLLITFVLAGYITIVINRWDRIRNTTLGQLWGSIENLCQVNFVVLFKHGNGKQEMDYRTSQFDMFDFRWSWLLWQFKSHKPVLFFIWIFVIYFNFLDVDDLSELVKLNLLTEKEQEWLAAASIGSRPLLVVSWLLELFYSIKAAGYFCVCFLYV